MKLEEYRKYTRQRQARVRQPRHTHSVNSESTENPYSQKRDNRSRAMSMSFYYFLLSAIIAELYYLGSTVFNTNIMSGYFSPATDPLVALALLPVTLITIVTFVVYSVHIGRLRKS